MDGGMETVGGYLSYKIKYIFTMSYSTSACPFHFSRT